MFKLSSKNLSKCQEMQIFKFKQGKLSGDYNNDEKNKATKGTKMYKTWLTSRGRREEEL